MAFTYSESARRSGFGSPSKTQSDIYTKPLNGKTRTPKTFHQGLDVFPAISSDGSKIAFSSNRSGTFDIYVTNSASGRAKRQVTSSNSTDIAPSWSSDGSKIAFSRFSAAAADWEIWVCDLNTGSLTNLVPGLFPKFHPTEDTLLFQRYSNNTSLYGLWTIDLLGTEEVEVISSPDTSYINPSWSPDGNRIVFASSNVDRKTYRARSGLERIVSSVLAAGANDIWTVRRDGTELTQLTTHPGEDWLPTWGSSGRIYFTSDRDNFNNIWSVMPEFVNIMSAPNEIEEGDI